jgi:hypothetical protein
LPQDFGGDVSIAPDKTRLGTMRPASRLFDLLTVQAIEPGIGIGLKHAGEVRQMCSRTFTFAIWTVAKEHRRGIFASCGPIVPHIGPQPPLLGGATARAEHWHRGIIAVNLVGLEHVAANRVHQRLKQRTRAAHPVGKG